MSMKSKLIKLLAVLAAAPAFIGAAYMSEKSPLRESIDIGIATVAPRRSAILRQGTCETSSDDFDINLFANTLCIEGLEHAGDIYKEQTEMTSARPAPEQHLIAYFSTYYKESSEGRKHNIALAASKIDGTVLYPEDEFSFNDVVGRRTEANGFKTAYIIQDGEFVEGVGGGVCQVSSTLYNCALLSGLDVTCVRAHSLAVNYVAPSFDAMVSTASDLRFVNTLSAPVTIRMSADGNYLRAEIYGVDDIAIRRRSETVETLPFEIEYRDDESLRVGEEKIDSYGKEGLRSEGYLEYFKDGKLFRTVRIRRDTYMPQKRVILRGCGEPKI